MLQLCSLFSWALYEVVRPVAGGTPKHHTARKNTVIIVIILSCGPLLSEQIE